jgi:diacylglycerol kinase family enzyme
MQNISVYFNHRASHSAPHWQDKINHALFRSIVDYKSPATLLDLEEELVCDVNNSVDAVLSIGGDGTAHNIIQKLAGTDIGLLLIPNGTANDLANGLGATTNLKSITQTIRNNRRKKVDLISINGKYMATNGGLGFASEVAQKINELRENYSAFQNLMKISGKRIYSLFLAKKFLMENIRTYRFKVTSEEFSKSLTSSLILINNQPILANTFEVAPLTNHNDGTFNVTIFTHDNRFELVQCLVKILMGTIPEGDPNLISFETKELKVDLLENKPISFFGDGEVFSETKSWDIKIHPEYLSVFDSKIIQ